MTFLAATLALIGLADTLYILRKKGRNEHLVCVIGKNCEAVINSRYSKLLLGVDNLVWGALFYVGVLAVGLLGGLVPPESRWLVEVGLDVAVSAAAATSLVLTYIQLRVLHELCEYCTVTNVINVLLFFIVVLGS